MSRYSQLSLKAILPALLAFISISVAAQTAGQNYILTREPNRAITTDTKLNTLTSNKDSVRVEIRYLDGLGRQLQTVKQQASPLGYDVIQAYIYNSKGQQYRQYLPYVNTSTSYGTYRPDALTAGAGVDAYYNPGGGTIEGNRVGGVIQTPVPYAQTVFEASPQGRVIEQGYPGTAWKTGTSPDDDHTQRVSFSSNDAGSFNTTDITTNPGSHKVALYRAVINSDGSYMLARTGNSETYAAGLLTLKVTKNENWKTGDGCFGTTEKYINKEGNLVLIRTYNIKGLEAQMLSTYYVYDDREHLAFVLPPGTDPDNTTGPISLTTLNDMSYQYRYDERGRGCQKKTPGKGWEFTVYNKLDQVIAVQDSLQRQKAPQEWTVNKYDALGRIVISGVYQYGAVAGANYLLAIQSQAYTAGTLWETTVAAGNGYTNNAWPLTVSTLLKVNYYDRYTDIPGLPANFDYQNNALYSKMTEGVITASKTLVINTTSDYLWKVQYYNEDGLVSRTFTQHYVGGNAALSTYNYDDWSTDYNFNRQPILSIRRHYISNAGTSAILKLTQSDVYTYDHMGRKILTTDTLKDGTNLAQAPVILAKNTYNEIGQPIKKGLHSLNGTSFLQNVDYRYNARGWLSHINNSSLSNDSGVTNSDAGGNDKFGMELKYDGGATPQYNGNVGYMKTQTGSFSGTSYLPQVYNYSYDKLNRLTDAISTTLSNNDGFYNENISYDIMGNILKMKRYEKSGNFAVLIDDLTYTYEKGYLHDRIDDAAIISGGFVDAVKQPAEYSYDANGNQLKDLNRGITGINYNLLNLQQTVTNLNGNSVVFVYDADGNKLRKLSTMGSMTTITEYISGLQYEYTGSTPLIAFVTTGEGRARKSGSAYKYEYDLKDHLGNTRVTLTWSSFDAANQTTPIIVQRDDYYAFGSSIASLSSVSSPKNQYLYNGKELIEETGLYDYGARSYDPLIGRWTGVDPLAEINRISSPYTYGKNNPIRFIDPEGMSDEDFNDSDEEDESFDKDVFGRERHDSNGIYIPAFERGGVDWSQFSINSALNPPKMKEPGDPVSQVLTRAQQLDKFGKIVFASNINGQWSIVGGVAMEFGVITTDKGWNQAYRTTYPAAYGFARSITYTIGLIKSKDAVFSDWRGSYVGIAASYGYGSIAMGSSSAYSFYGVGFGYGWGVKSYNGFSGSLSFGETTLIGQPYRTRVYPVGQGMYSNSYISELLGN